MMSYYCNIRGNISWIFSKCYRYADPRIQLWSHGASIQRKLTPDHTEQWHESMYNVEVLFGTSGLD